ncbi:unnamed protein product [Anisakis simplex]|uniref:G-protein coupled receptors family 1 profile domain-containing protein n=1 Tax=Anisakis simplex TaxID=6269 RepID=A0A0M3JEP1_ANISI|nr:unnamed protein product [Anisakis simplex]
MNTLQLMLYEICIPLILLICLLSTLLNIFILYIRFHIKTVSSNSLELIFSLAASDTWTSIVIALSLFINSYMPVILGIRQSSLCFSLTLEVKFFWSLVLINNKKHQKIPFNNIKNIFDLILFDLLLSFDDIRRY